MAPKDKLGRPISVGSWVVYATTRNGLLRIGRVSAIDSIGWGLCVEDVDDDSRFKTPQKTTKILANSRRTLVIPTTEIPDHFQAIVGDL